MARLAICLLLAATTIAACGVIKDPSPEDVDEFLRVRAGSSRHGHVYIDGDDVDPSDYVYWDEHVRDLPGGFDFDTLDVDDDDGDVAITYEVEVEDWVQPGYYDFEVRYEFWPDDSIIRKEYRVEITVKVKPRE